MSAKPNIQFWKGERLKAFREDRDWSLADLAKRLDVSQNAISKWERNKDAPTHANIAKLCIIFGASADYFFGFVDAPYEYLEESKLPPDERELLRLYRSGKLPLLLGKLLLANLQGGQDLPLIEDQSGDSTASEDKTPNR